MIIDIEQIITGKKDTIVINENIDIPKVLLEKSSIRTLKNVTFEGKVKRLYDLPLTLEGNLKGKMILLDDITLEEVEYNFNIELEEELENSEDELEQLIVDNKLDLLNILWQLIQVEIPSKIHKNDTDITMSGNGWKLISEQDLNNNKNNAFKDLDKLLAERSQE